MKFFYVLCILSVCSTVFSATLPTEPVWPSWVGVSRGADDTVADKTPIAGDDDHANYDHGNDSYGWWANLEVTHADGSILAVEMRYIVPRDGMYDSPDYGAGKISNAYAFYMGAAIDEQGALQHEKPQYRVPWSAINSSKPMWVAANECSQKLWEAVTGNVLTQRIPFDQIGHGQTDANLPTTVAFVGGDPAKRAVELQSKSSVDQFLADLGNGARLPNEMEWEYLCRAGTATAFNTGRLLNGLNSTQSTVGNITVTASHMLFPNYVGLNIDDMWAGDPNNASNGDAPIGDNFTDPWAVGISYVNADKTAFWNMMGSDIRGKLTLAGSAVIEDKVVSFDSRYQHRYVRDDYGEYTPILMVYYSMDETEFFPRPYGNPGAGKMYYRYLDLVTPGEYNNKVDYVLCSDVDLINNKDKHDNKQLEYREMIRIVDRNATTFTVREADGTKDGKERGYPVLHIYSPAPFWTLGNQLFATGPSVPGIDLSKFAKSQVPDGCAMTTDKYIEAYFDVINAEYGNSVAGGIDPSKYFANYNGVPPFTPAQIEKFAGVTAFSPGWFMQDSIAVDWSAAQIGMAYFERNAWGLYSMHGNVEEWCSTEWDGLAGPGVAPSPINPKKYVTRGGSWRLGADRCRSAARTARMDQAYDDVGFRFIISE